MAEVVTVAVDANGADLGPAEVAAGAALAAQQGGIRVLVFGPAAELGDPAEGVEIVDAPRSIAKEADPARAVRANPDSSIVQAARAVADGRADALVSGGATGVTLAAGLFHLRRAQGVIRPALAVVVPVPGAPVLFLDVGANAEARPEHLVQFAVMGHAFARGVLGMEAPRIGLLSNGEEPTRGTADVLAAHQTLAAAEGLTFVGNVEGTGLVAGAADVVVADGFTGNVALKVMEGVSATLMGAVKDTALLSARGRAGGALLRPSLRGLRDELDPEAAGGAYLLGLRHLVVVGHGRFTRRGFAEAIGVAARGVREHVVERTHDALATAGALRGDAPASGDPTTVREPA
jgi:glycerol-3-phosphate acyltransferase PlsX